MKCQFSLQAESYILPDNLENIANSIVLNNNDRVHAPVLDNRKTGFM